VTERQERVDKVNELVRVIGNCGRRFFYSTENDRYAAIEIDKHGRVWWVDDYSGKRIYTHYRYWKRGFSHGGTLHNLVNAFRDYVSKGKPVSSSAFGPWPDWLCDGDLWGYGDDMQQIRDTAIRLGITGV
jgi:hypothetical protein